MRPSAVGWSATRISSVPKRGFGRMSHQMRVWSSSTPSATSRSTHASHASYPANAGGAPARGSSARIPALFESIPVASPSTNGELTDSASTTGSQGSTASSRS